MKQIPKSREEILALAIHPVIRTYSRPAIAAYRPDLLEEYDKMGETSDAIIGHFSKVQKELEKKFGSCVTGDTEEEK